MATKSDDGTVKLWPTRDWTTPKSLDEKAGSGWGSVAFHPTALLLASLADGESQVRVWKMLS